MKPDCSSPSSQNLAIELYFESIQSGFDVFTAVKIQIEVFWAVTPCSFAVRAATFRRATLPPASGWQKEL
jgi:hypothetical protein